MRDLAGKKVIITGASSGIGRELTRMLFEHEAEVAFCGRTGHKLRRTIDEIGEAAERSYSHAFDISSENSIIDFVDEARRRLGGFDILINCAGANTARAAVGEIKTSDLEMMLKINLTAPFVFMREVYRDMAVQRSGMIINVLSTVSRFANESLGAYTASKAGLEGLVNVFRKEARNNNVKICSVYPGGVDTDFRHESRPEYLNPETVAESIISIILMSGQGSVDEFTIRPMIEKNYS